MYDVLKDHGGYKGRGGGNFASSLLLAATIIGGSILWDKWQAKKNAKKQEKLWNGGFCAKCGRKWKYHWFYPKGSRGKYKRLAIDCANCKIHQDMDAYTPPEIENPNN